MLILGCTHYPLLTDIIREIMGPEVSLVNAGAESVHTLHDALARRQLTMEWAVLNIHPMKNRP